jgi:hypothetical protein
MTQPRFGQAATPPSNGLILIAGGWTGSAALDSAEAYNPSTGGFSATVSMTKRRQAALTAPLELSDGFVLIAGGTDGSVALA